MGRVEKIVVLSVMFVVVVIFAVTLNTGDPRSDSGSPVHAAQSDSELGAERMAGGLPLGGLDEEVAALANEPQYTPVPVGPYGAAGPEAQKPAPVPERKPEVRVPAGASTPAEPVARESAPLLSSSVSASKTPSPVRIEANWDLKTATALEPTVNPMLMLYTCRRGDSFESLAQLYYGDATKARLLQQNNEGMTTLTEGLEILVPVRDDSGPATSAHTVEDGENLWSIAKRFYGRGSRWGEIYEANRDLLKSPDSLKVGMTLMIP